MTADISLMLKEADASDLDELKHKIENGKVLLFFWSNQTDEVDDEGNGDLQLTIMRTGNVEGLMHAFNEMNAHLNKTGGVDLTAG